MIAALLLAQAVQAASDPPDRFNSWGQFTRAPVLGGGEQRVEIGGDGVTGARPEYRFRFRREQPGQPVEWRWASTRTCPTARGIVDGAGRLPTLRFAPATPRTVPVVLDGTLYVASLPVAGVADDRNLGNVFWSSNVGTPLAVWVDDSLTRLKPCWSSKPAR